MKLRPWLALLGIGCLNTAAADDGNLLSLEPAMQPRIAAVARSWPEAPGEPVVCLWKDDKQMAFSLTIDDNHAEDHPFWLEAASTYGWKWTWFVITGKVGAPGPWGAWTDWQVLAAAGHDVQSHSVQHLNPKQTEPLSIEQEYEQSQRMIQENIPGMRCLTLAYPNGYKLPNDDHIAARYYLACRGVRGFPNPPGQVNYRDVNSISAATGFTEPETHWASFAGCLNPANAKKFGSWYCCHFHGLNDELKNHVDHMLALLKENESDVWVGTFREVAQYGQERDTAKVAVTRKDATAVEFVVTDEMDDTAFDVPLTIKLRLPDDWPEATAQQDGQRIPVVRTSNKGAAFALVSATPDRGPVVVEKNTSP